MTTLALLRPLKSANDNDPSNQVAIDASTLLPDPQGRPGVTVDAQGNEYVLQGYRDSSTTDTRQQSQPNDGFVTATQGVRVYNKTTGQVVVANGSQKFDPNQWSTTPPTNIQIGPAGTTTNGIPNTPASTTTTTPAATTSTASVIPRANTPTPAPATSSITAPNVNLQPGATGDSVKQLQDYLVSKGYMTQAQVNTGYGTYGPQTTAAVAKMQSALGVDNSSGVGYFGPKTMQAIQSAPASSTGTVGGSTASAGGTTAGDTSTSGTTTLTSTGNANLDAAQSALQGQVTAAAANGVIPPGLQITPELIGTFLSWAHQNVDPQTQQLLSGEAANINASLTNAQKQYQASQGQIAQDFGTNLATEQNQAGNSGTAFSGQRRLNESNIANSANRQLSSLDASTALNVGNTLRQGGADVGSSNSDLFKIPTFNSGNVSTLGGSRGSFGSGSSLDFGYNPSLYRAGNIPTAQNTVLNDTQANYIKQYGNFAANNSTQSISDILKMMTGAPSTSTNINNPTRSIF